MGKRRNLNVPFELLPQELVEKPDLYYFRPFEVDDCLEMTAINASLDAADRAERQERAFEIPCLAFDNFGSLNAFI